MFHLYGLKQVPLEFTDHFVAIGAFSILIIRHWSEEIPWIC